MVSHELYSNIGDLVSSSIETFVDMVVEKYPGTDKDGLLALWNDNNPKPTTTPKPTPTPPTPTPQEPTQSKTNSKTCIHVWVKGAKKGTMCGCIVKNPTREYCSKHVKANNVTVVTKQAVVSSASKSKILRRNKSIDKLWHEDTGMVFESVQDRSVTHRYVDGELKSLTPDDIIVCKEMGFAIKNTVPDTEKKVEQVSTIKEVEDLLGALQMTDSDESEEEMLEEEE